MREIIGKILEAEEEARRIVADAEADAERILSDARRQAQQEAESIRRDARTEADRLIDEAVQASEREKAEHVKRAAEAIDAEFLIDDVFLAEAVQAIVQCVSGEP